MRLPVGFVKIRIQERNFPLYEKMNAIRVNEYNIEPNGDRAAAK
jgi:hypothetical protein